MAGVTRDELEAVRENSRAALTPPRAQAGHERLLGPSRRRSYHTCRYRDGGGEGRGGGLPADRRMRP